MFFYAGLAAIYFVVTLWYHCGMKMYQEAAIPIQKYILATMVVGFLEVAFLGIDLFIWNINGLRYPAVAYTGKFFSITNEVVLDIKKCIYNKSHLFLLLFFLINHYLHNESSRFGSPEERLFAMFRGDGCYGLGRCTRISRSDIG
jgi:hypothetical protein